LWQGSSGKQCWQIVGEAAAARLQAGLRIFCIGATNRKRRAPEAEN
jgi:predicted kinase